MFLFLFDCEGAPYMERLPFRSQIEPVELERICECQCPEGLHSEPDYDVAGDPPRYVPCRRPCSACDCRSFSEDR